MKQLQVSLSGPDSRRVNANFLDLSARTEMIFETRRHEVKFAGPALFGPGQKIVEVHPGTPELVIGEGRLIVSGRGVTAILRATMGHDVREVHAKDVKALGTSREGILVCVLGETVAGS